MKYREGFIKNRYIGRTFIMPGQAQRAKVGAPEAECDRPGVQRQERAAGRRLDRARHDSAQIIADGARGRRTQGLLRIAAPPVRYPNVYGIDMPSAGEFVAYNRTDEEVARVIGADWLLYQNTDDLVACAVEGNPRITRYECSIFDGDYVTGDIDDADLERLSLNRNDLMKQRREADDSGDHSFIELHNHA